jgi:hypothetical protein
MRPTSVKGILTLRSVRNWFGRRREAHDYESGTRVAGILMVVHIVNLARQEGLHQAEKFIPPTRAESKTERPAMMMGWLVRKAVLADLIEFFFIEASRFVQVEELVRNALTEHRHVIGVDGHSHARIEQFSDRM